MKVIQVFFGKMGRWWANEEDNFGSKAPVIDAQDSAFESRISW
jgi:hypothetical protein